MHPVTDQHESAQSIGTIAAARPASIAVFERYGLDYCCHGDRSIADACAARGADLAVVLREIDSAERGATEEDVERRWTDASMTELADHIEYTHHEFARQALARLAETLPRVVRVHGEAHPELREVAEIVAAMSEDMHDHFVREERVLFPWLRRLDRHSELHTGPPWSVKRPIDCMEHDHDELGTLFARLRSLTADYAAPQDGCASYRSVMDTLRSLERDTHIHIHKENNILFPAGIRAEEASQHRTTAARKTGA